MADATVVAVPSYLEEPCSTVVLEGLGLGKTVYALALGGTREPWVRSAGSGRLVLADTIESLAERLAEHGDHDAGPLAEHGSTSVHTFADRIVSQLEEIFRA